MTVTFRPGADTVWLAAHPALHAGRPGTAAGGRGRCPHAVVEVIGKTARGRDLHLVTVTDPDVPDCGQEVPLAPGPPARVGGRHVVGGRGGAAVPHVRRPRRPRPAAAGGVPVHADGRPRRVRRRQGPVQRQRLRRQPPLGPGRPPPAASTCGTCPRSGTRKRRSSPPPAPAVRQSGIDLLVNLHNTETAEYLETHARDAASIAAVRRLSELLVERTSFDPSRDVSVQGRAGRHGQRAVARVRRPGGADGTADRSRQEAGPPPDGRRPPGLRPAVGRGDGRSGPVTPAGCAPPKFPAPAECGMRDDRAASRSGGGR